MKLRNEFKITINKAIAMLLDNKVEDDDFIFESDYEEEQFERILEVEIYEGIFDY